MSPLERATIVAFNATATEEQKRLRDAILSAYGETPEPEPAPSKQRRAYGSVTKRILADLREHPRSRSSDVVRRVGAEATQLCALAARGVIIREPSGHTAPNGNPSYLYSVKEPA